MGEGGFPSYFLPLVSLFCLLFVLFFQTRPYSSQALLELSIAQTGLGLMTVILPQPPAPVDIPKSSHRTNQGKTHLVLLPWFHIQVRRGLKLRRSVP